MTFSAPDLLSTTLFVLLCAGVAASLPIGIFFASRSPKNAGFAAVGLLLFLGLTALPVASGFLEQAPMPRLLIFLGSINLAGLILGLSPVGRILASLPLSVLVAFQGFRFPLELILHHWVKLGSIPPTMTWTGQNWDIVTGIVSLAVVPLAARYRRAASIANAIGFALLVNVARVAVLSSPVPFGWQVSPPLQLAFHLPYAAIVPLGIGAALVGHMVLTRALVVPKR